MRQNDDLCQQSILHTEINPQYHDMITLP